MSIHNVSSILTSGSHARRESGNMPDARLPVVIDDYSLQPDPAVAPKSSLVSKQAFSVSLISHQTAFQLSRYREYLALYPHHTDSPPQYGAVQAAYHPQNTEIGKTRNTQA